MNKRSNIFYPHILTCFYGTVLLFLILQPFSANAQYWEWVATAGGSESDKSLDIDIDKYGNEYICGFYNSTSPINDVNFGPIAAPGDFGKEGFLAKIDSSGNWIWERHAFGGWDERVLGMCIDNINDVIYTTGTSWFYTNFGSCSSAMPSGGGGSDNLFVTKFDLNGNCQWHIAAGADADDHGYDLITDKLGNVYLTGFVSDKYHTGTEVAYFGSISFPIPYADTLGFVAKISPAGVWQWVRTFQGTEGERDNRIAIDSSDNVYVTGGFYGTKPFGTLNATSNGGYDVFVLKFDSNGNTIWVRTAGSTLDDRGNSITVDEHQDVYLTGEFRDHIGFGSDSLNNNGGPGGRDIFVAKLTNNGNWIWAKKAGSDGGSDRGNRIVANKKEMLFITGQFKGNARFGSADTLYNSSDSIQIFVAAIDTSGTWQWAIQAGSTVEDRGTGIAVDDSCNIYTTGYYEETALFGNISNTAKGRKDIFVGKIPNACVPSAPPPPSIAECTPSVPNIFTPNNDQLNDIFFVKGNCIDLLTVSIYNRWGTMVYQINGANENWNGKTKNGNDASEGVYYFIGESKLANGETYPIKGFITLVR